MAVTCSLRVQTRHFLASLWQPEVLHLSEHSHVSYHLAYLLGQVSFGHHIYKTLFAYPEKKLATSAFRHCKLWYFQCIQVYLGHCCTESTNIGGREVGLTMWHSSDVTSLLKFGNGVGNVSFTDVHVGSESTLWRMPNHRKTESDNALVDNTMPHWRT